MEAIDHESYHRLERLFVEGYRSASDKMLYLKMAHIPFEILPQEGQPHLFLKSIQIEETVEVGHVFPAFASTQLVHQMYPHEHVKTAFQLKFIYVHSLGIAQKTLESLHHLHIQDSDHHH